MESHEQLDTGWAFGSVESHVSNSVDEVRWWRRAPSRGTYSRHEGMISGEKEGVALMHASCLVYRPGVELGDLTCLERRWRCNTRCNRREADDCSGRAIACCELC